MIYSRGKNPNSHKNGFEKGHPPTYRGGAKFGHKVSDEQKRKIGLANSKSLKGHIPWNKGKSNPHFSGNNNVHWKGGISRPWLRKQTLIRDDYICQICGLREPEIMEVDHSIPISVNPALKSSLENLVTLCPNCHRKKTNREKRSNLYGRWKLKS